MDLQNQQSGKRETIPMAFSWALHWHHGAHTRQANKCQNFKNSSLFKAFHINDFLKKILKCLNKQRGVYYIMLYVIQVDFGKQYCIISPRESGIYENNHISILNRPSFIHFCACSQRGSFSSQLFARRQFSCLFWKQLHFWHRKIPPNLPGLKSI